ncbi:INO80 complex subunit D [Camellia lanceoleosa]|uniref:INO80 complex subunit D n=1 Tax=Camellia lanceoleosa TaxID=1840588 RepID=A0ACC0IW13_9ERIC|nr:INO80 complex subunit D [Camellia lanceoleosa]
MASASNHFSHNHRLSLHSQIPPNSINPNPNPDPNPNPNAIPTNDIEDKNPNPNSSLRLRVVDSSSDMAEPSNNNNNNNNNIASSSSAATRMEIVIDGSDSDFDFDSALSRSPLLTRPKVFKRRTRRLKQLSKIYRDHYWSLMEDLKLKYRDYYWDYGKSPFLKDEDILHSLNRNHNINYGTTIIPDDIQHPLNNAKLGLGLGLGLGSNGNANRCEVHGCKMKAMALTRFCHSHILSDAKQELYKGCTYVTKSSPTGPPTLCMKPILRSTVPSLCPLHLQKAEKHVTRALRKAGLNVTSTSKLAPKFHVVVAEYVRQIQSKRKAAQKALVGAVESKVGNTV